MFISKKKSLVFSFVQKKNENYHVSKIKVLALVIFLFINLIKNNHVLKLAICTMARKENLYIKEYVDYNIKLGFDHIFIFDDNEPNIAITELMKLPILEKKNKK